MAGWSKAVIENRNALILSQIEKHAPNGERYMLIAKVVNVGVALLVYGRDDGIGREAVDIQTQWTGCGPAYMGNKGAVGVRFRVPGEGEDGGVGEVYTCVFRRGPASHAHIHMQLRLRAPYRARAQERGPYTGLPHYRR